MYALTTQALSFCGSPKDICAILSADMCGACLNGPATELTEIIIYETDGVLVRECCINIPSLLIVISKLAGGVLGVERNDMSEVRS